MTDQGFRPFRLNHRSDRMLHRVLRSFPLGIGLTAFILTAHQSVPVWAQNSHGAPITLSQQIPVNAQLIYINPVQGTDSPGRGSSEATPYRTITYALANLPQTQNPIVIQLARGTYTAETGETFPLTLPSNVILRGDEQNKGQTTSIIGGGIFISPTFARQNVVIVARQNSQIRGLTVTNPNTRGTGIWVEATNPIIRNNTFINSNREGVFVTGRGNPTIEDNVFTQNLGNGVSVAVASQGTIRNNVFRNTGFGIAVSQTAAPLIEGNQIIQNTDGVVVSDSATPVLRRNVIEANTRDGIVAITNAQPNLGTASEPGQNIIQNNGRYDIHNATRSNTLLAAGNQSSTQRIQGLVDFVAADVDLGTGEFLDVQGHWAEAYIIALAEKGVISGFPDRTYRPEDPVNRAQFAAIINKAFNPPPERPGIEFIDVSRNFWGYSAIQTAYRGGFMSGYPGGRFEPLLSIPRVQVLVSLASGLELTTTNLSVLSTYVDSNQIPSYAVEEVAATTQSGIVVNYPNVSQLNPNRNATRAEVAAFVYQALVNAGQAQPIESPYVVRVP